MAKKSRAKAKTTHPRQRARSRKLQVRVMSPRIAWFSFLRFLGGLFKLACWAVVAAGLSWAIWQGIQKAFYQNPDFRLQAIDLNANSAIDVNDVANVAGINEAGSLFDIDVKKVVAHLQELPEIERARAERHLPGTLVVNVVARVPRAWIASPSAGISGERKIGGILVDASGFAYPCPRLQFEEASKLPVIVLPGLETLRIQIGSIIRHPELARCFDLLDSACAEDPEAIHWVQSVKQANKWSLLLVTRDGTEATFGLRDHPRQIQNLRMAMDHANQQSYAIATINLIPKQNIPITLRSEPSAPRALPVTPLTAEELLQQRRARDIGSLLNRN